MFLKEGELAAIPGYYQSDMPLIALGLCPFVTQLLGDQNLYPGFKGHVECHECCFSSRNGGGQLMLWRAPYAA